MINYFLPYPAALTAGDFLQEAWQKKLRDRYLLVAKEHRCSTRAQRAALDPKLVSSRDKLVEALGPGLLNRFLSSLHSIPSLSRTPIKAS